MVENHPIETDSLFLLMKKVDLFRALAKESASLVMMSKYMRLSWSLKHQSSSSGSGTCLQDAFYNKRELLQETKMEIQIVSKGPPSSGGSVEIVNSEGLPS